MLRKMGLLLTVGFVIMMPMIASANYIFNLNEGNTDISGYPGPYATVDVSLTNSTTATVTFTSLSKGNNYYLLGDGGIVGINVNGDYTLGSVTESNTLSGFSPTYNNNSPGNEDGFGSFTLSLNNKDGYKDSATSVSFTIIKNSGTWDNDANVLIPNSLGYIAAAHIFVSTGDVNVDALKTGFAGGKGTAPVPEPCTTLLLGSGLIGVAAFRKRFGKA